MLGIGIINSVSNKMTNCGWQKKKGESIFSNVTVRGVEEVSYFKMEAVIVSDYV